MFISIFSPCLSYSKVALTASKWSQFQNIFWYSYIRIYVCVFYFIINQLIQLQKIFFFSLNFILLDWNTHIVTSINIFQTYLLFQRGIDWFKHWIFSGCFGNIWVKIFWRIWRFVHLISGKIFSIRRLIHIYLSL